MNRNALIVVAAGAAVACSIMVAQTTEVFCPDSCDCEIAKSGVKDCVTGITPCQGKMPVWNEEEQLFYCTDATHYEKGWPVGCEKSAWKWVQVDSDEDPRKVYESWTNCNQVNDECHHPVTCRVEDSTLPCVVQERSGDWTYQYKIVESDCAGDPP